MDIDNEDAQLPPKAARAAIVIGAVAAIITAGAVSWGTPDGNLVVTLVPALTIGLIAFGLARWIVRHGGRR